MVSQRKVGVVLGYVNIVVKNLVNLVYTPMLLSFVGQADYGVYQTSSSFVFSLSLLSFGFSQAYVRFYTQRQANEDEAGIKKLNGVYLVLYAVVSLAALIIGLGFSASTSRIFSSSFTLEQIRLAEVVMAIMAGSIAVTLFNSVFDAYVLAHEEFRFQQSRQLVTTLATPFMAYALLLAGLGVIGVAIAQLVVNVALLVLNASFCLNKLGMRFEVRDFDRGLLRSLAAFSAWIFANQVCELVNQNVPNVVLGAFCGASIVAVFSLSVQLRQLFYSLSTTMSNMFVPMVNRIVADSNDNSILTGLMTRVGRYQAILYAWVLGGFTVLGRFFVSRWAGNEFDDVYWLVILMVAPLAVPLVQNTGIEIQRAKNMHRARSVAYLATACLNVALTAALAPSLGYWAPAIGYVSYVVCGCGVFMNWYYQRRVGLNMLHFWARVLPAFLCGAIATLACMLGTSFVPVDSWSTFFLWGVIYSGLYAAGIWLIVLNSSERAEVSRKIGAIRK